MAVSVTGPRAVNEAQLYRVHLVFIKFKLIIACDRVAIGGKHDIGEPPFTMLVQHLPSIGSIPASQQT